MGPVCPGVAGLEAQLAAAAAERDAARKQHADAEERLRSALADRDASVELHRTGGLVNGLLSESIFAGF